MEIKQLSLWQRFSFSDVNVLLRKFKNQPAEVEDVLTHPQIATVMNEKDDYPEFRRALPHLRNKILFSVARFEGKSLWKMFLIHILDVHLSLVSAVLGIKVLEIFQSSRSVGFACLCAASVFVLNLTASSLHAQKVEREMLLYYRIQSKITKFIFEFMMNMSTLARQKFKIGDIVNLAQSDARNISLLFAHGFVDIPVLIVSSTVIVFFLHLYIGDYAWLALGLVLLQIPFSAIFAAIGTRLHREMMKRSDHRISLITEWIQGMRLVRYFNWGDAFKNQIFTASRREFQQDMKEKTNYSIAFALSTTWWIVVCAGIMVAFIVNGMKATAPQIFATVWLTNILGHQLNPLPWFIDMFAQSRVGGKRLEGLFQEKIQDEEDVESEKSFSGDVLRPEFKITTLSCQNLSLRFPGQQAPAFVNVNFVAQAGQVIAIEGGVGSGKTSLLQCLCSELQPSSGSVSFSCAEASQAFFFLVHSPEGRKVLRSKMALVTQESFITSATIQENIPLSFGTEDNVMNALMRAQLDADIAELQGGMLTMIGERGVTLSGGQKQRVSLARMFHRDAQILFLDDPLSAVDVHTERKLIRELVKMKDENKIVIIATHRKEILKFADVVINLEDHQSKRGGA